MFEEHREEFLMKEVLRVAIQSKRNVEILLIINRGETQHGQLSVEESISVNTDELAE